MRPHKASGSAVAVTATAAPKPSAGDTVDVTPLFESDPQIGNYREHFDFRIDQFKGTLATIEANAGSLASFAGAFNTQYGFIRDEEKGATVYREWAPGAVGAQLIGDFNNWEGWDMQRDDFGVWSVTVPDVDGKAAIPHASRV